MGNARTSWAATLLVTAALASCGAAPWRYSRLYQPTNPTSQFYSALPGLDLLENDEFQALQGLTVAVVTNHTGMNMKARHILDLLTEHPDITVKVAFGPEHGLAGNVAAGEKVEDSRDNLSGITVYSLYGSSRKPTPDQLAGIDVVLFDMQDVGARYYTFVSTLTLVMDACARDRVPIWVLDRPTPVRGDIIAGPLLDPAYSSFVGMHPVPIRHGMTLGELAVMINEEGWLTGNRHAELTVIPVVNYNRYDWWEDTGLSWIPPSPNIPTPEIALAYLGTCLLEGTNISEGRGTHTPFVLAGAPWIEGASLARQLRQWQLPGVMFHDTTYTPVPIAGMAPFPKFANEELGGVRLEITDRLKFRPIETAAVMIHVIKETYPHQFKWSASIDRLWGSDSFRRYIDNGRSLKAHPSTYRKDRGAFFKLRKPYLIYDD
ncbi:MAG: DUF1343 domain-containing protein [Candidatus Marinimicrobia bacterium]|nr:DUF1343 domain-containing protein [Candidatus Neomarinimicrobiota bacterium]